MVKKKGKTRREISKDEVKKTKTIIKKKKTR